MERKKHRHKKNHVIILTSDAADADARQFRIRPWFLRVLAAAFCIAVGVLLGYVIYNRNVWEAAQRRVKEQMEIAEELRGLAASKDEEMETLNDRVRELEYEVAQRDETIGILSETVKQKTQTEQELTKILEKQALPTEYPLTGSASVEESTQGDPVLIFTASQGVTVVATASGTVTAINDDAEYGHNVWVDHGNGYVTIYRNQGETNVKLGDKVAQGTTIFLIGSDNVKFGYQIMRDGAYINPMDMLSISG